MRKIPCYLIDANCINARQKEEAINKLEELYAEGKISLTMPEIAYFEAKFGSLLRQKSQGLSLRGSCRSRATIRIQICADRKHRVSQWSKKTKSKK